MVHSEHNRSRGSGWFALIIFGAILLFLAPTAIYPTERELGTAAFVAGLVIGGMGFFMRYVRTRNRDV